MMHQSSGPFGPLGFVSYDRSVIDHNSPSCSGFRSYQGVAPGGVDPVYSTSPYYAPTFTTTPYIGSLGFRSVTQQNHFHSDHSQPFVDYRYYPSQSATLAPTYENTRYNDTAHMLDTTPQPFRWHHQGSSSTTFLVDHQSNRRPGPTTAGPTTAGPASTAFSSQLIGPSYSPVQGEELLARGRASPTRRHGNVLRSPEVEKVVLSSSGYTSSGNDVSSPEVTSRQQASRKKQPLAVPEEQKDGQYWARRRKNNESAKKSRETRRVKAALAEKRMKCLEEEVERKRTLWKLLHKELNELK